MIPFALLAAAFLSPPPPALSLRVESHDLGLRREIVSFAARDANGDGRRDLVFLTRETAPDGSGALALRALVQEAPRRFAAAATAALPVPAGAICHSIEDVLAAPGDEWVLVFADRVEVRSLRTGSDEALATVSVAGAARFPPPRALPWLDVARDVDGDGRRDLVLPSGGGYAVALQAAAGAFASPLLLEIESSASIETSPVRWLSVEERLPRLVVRDTDGDGLPEILRCEGETIAITRVRGGRMERGEWTAAPMPFLAPPAARDALSGATVLIDDADGDGRADLVAALQRGSIGLGSEISTNLLYFPGEAGSLAAKPAQVLSVKGLALSPRLVDVDGDGARDLLVPTADTDVLSNVRKLLLRDFTVDYQGFLFDPKKKRFAAAPSFTETVSIPAAAVDRRESVPLASFDGDFDGDGTKDALRVRPPGGIAVHRGAASRSLLGGASFRFDEKPCATATSAVGNAFSVEDLDGDGRSDAVFWSGSSVTVLLAEGGGR